MNQIYSVYKNDGHLSDVIYEEICYDCAKKYEKINVINKVHGYKEKKYNIIFNEIAEEDYRITKIESVCQKCKGSFYIDGRSSIARKGLIYDMR